MNWDQIQGNWMQFKAGVRGNWVKLTDKASGAAATNWSNACKRVMASARTKRSGRSRPG
jgi:hypothetical protein